MLISPCITKICIVTGKHFGLGVEVDGVNVETVVHKAMEAGCDNGTGWPW